MHMYDLRSMLCITSRAQAAATQPCSQSCSTAYKIAVPDVSKTVQAHPPRCCSLKAWNCLRVLASNLAMPGLRSSASTCMTSHKDLVNTSAFWPACSSEHHRNRSYIQALSSMSWVVLEHAHDRQRLCDDCWQGHIRCKPEQLRLAASLPCCQGLSTSAETNDKAVGCSGRLLLPEQHCRQEGR